LRNKKKLQILKDLHIFLELKKIMEITFLEKLGEENLKEEQDVYIMM